MSFSKLTDINPKSAEPSGSLVPREPPPKCASETCSEHLIDVIRRRQEMKGSGVRRSVARPTPGRLCNCSLRYPARSPEIGCLLLSLVSGLRPAALPAGFTAVFFAADLRCADQAIPNTLHLAPPPLPARVQHLCGPRRVADPSPSGAERVRSLQTSSLLGWLKR